MRVAVLRCERLPRFVTWEIPDVESLFADDHQLLAAFAEREVDAEPVVWSRPDVDWAAYDAAVLRSTWDYVDHLGEFLEVAASIDRSPCTLLNPLGAVHWNADKHYLDDLGELLLPHVHRDERLERVAERHRVDAALVREEGAGCLEPCHPRLHRVARQREPVGERHDGGARVGREGRQQRTVHCVVAVHIATR